MEEDLPFTFAQSLQEGTDFFFFVARMALKKFQSDFKPAQNSMFSAVTSLTDAVELAKGHMSISPKLFNEPGNTSIISPTSRFPLLPGQWNK